MQATDISKENNNEEKQNSKSKALNILVTFLLIVCVAMCFSALIQTITKGSASIFGFRFYKVLTGSMEPTYATGSTVIIKNCDPGKLETGDVITFTMNSGAIAGYANTHRIVQITTAEDGTLLFWTKGDANNARDENPVEESAIIGKVVANVNFSAFSSFMSFVRTPSGFITCIVMPLLLLAWFVLKDFKNSLAAVAAERAKLELEEEEPVAADVPPDTPKTE